MFCSKFRQGLGVRRRFCPGSRRGPFKERVVGREGGPRYRKPGAALLWTLSALPGSASRLCAGPERSGWLLRRPPGAWTVRPPERSSPVFPRPSKASPPALGRGSASSSLALGDSGTLSSGAGQLVIHGPRLRSPFPPLLLSCAGGRGPTHPRFALERLHNGFPLGRGQASLGPGVWKGW